MSGRLPDPIQIQAPSEEPSSAPNPQAAPDATRDSSPDGGAAGAQEAAQQAEATHADEGELVEDSESFGEMPLEIRPSAASVSFGGAAAAGWYCSIKGASVHAFCDSLLRLGGPMCVRGASSHGLYIAGLRSPRRAARVQPRQCDRSVPNPRNPAAAARRLSAAAAELAWVGDASKVPPAGLSMQASQHRKFYGAIARVSLS